MEHVVASEVAGFVREIALEVGDTIFEDTPLLFIEPQDVDGEYVARPRARPGRHPP